MVAGLEPARDIRAHRAFPPRCRFGLSIYQLIYTITTADCCGCDPLNSAGMNRRTRCPAEHCATSFGLTGLIHSQSACVMAHGDRVVPIRRIAALDRAGGLYGAYKDV